MQIRVVELSRVLAGPVCGMILGDLGADIIKIERPNTGDETRGQLIEKNEWVASVMNIVPRLALKGSITTSTEK